MATAFSIDRVSVGAGKLVSVNNMSLTVIGVLNTKNLNIGGPAGAPKNSQDRQCTKTTSPSRMTNFRCRGYLPGRAWCGDAERNGRHLSPQSATVLSVVGPISCCDKIRLNSCSGPAMNVTLPRPAFLRVLLGQSRAMNGTQAGNIGLSMIALREWRKATNH